MFCIQLANEGLQCRSRIEDGKRRFVRAAHFDEREARLAGGQFIEQSQIASAARRFSHQPLSELVVLSLFG